MQQDQFLTVIDRDEAERRFHAVLDLRPLEAEEVALADALGRVLAADVVAPLDVPGFDRTNVDGFAVRAADTFGASEDHPHSLRLNAEALAPGAVPSAAVAAGTATAIATGAVVPRGADAVVMIEHTDAADNLLTVRRPVAPGANITFAGTDIGRGETVLRRGEVLTARETGVLAALGLARVAVTRRPRVAVVSTGDELIPPGAAMRPGLVYDSNAVILADSVRELGGEPVPFGVVPDDRAALLAVLRKALECDVVLLSGGTSKGAGDLSYRAAAELGPPGIVAHGVALKPGKPLCLAAVDRKPRSVPVVILPGFPTSAIFTFREFVAPVIRRLAGRPEERDPAVPARLPLRVNSERGRTEYLLVGLVESEGDPKYVAYPMGKGSGSVTTFSRADGFVVIPRQREYLEAGDVVEVHLLGRDLRPADLVTIGSHCTGLDYLLGRLAERGLRSKFLAVGSTGGLSAARRGECDVAGVHLLDPATGEYNRPFLAEDLLLVPGYGRLQGVVYRPGDQRFEGRTAEEAAAVASADPQCVLVNRNRGSGTRVLIDRLLGAARPPGWLTEARSHNAVVAAVAQGRADWGIAIESVARMYGLGFLPIAPEHYDFLIADSRRERPAMQAFLTALRDPEVRAAISAVGMRPSDA
jgi:molybdopterin molybdotransferase/putative molybdopterin biosynthesis protein